MKAIIRWHDGFLQKLDITDYQCGSDNYWVKLVSGRGRWLPKNKIRYMDIVESDEKSE